jgi:hypothetical protein
MSILAALTAIPAILNGASKMVTGFTDLAATKVRAAADAEMARIKSGEAVELKTEDVNAILAQLQQAIVLADQQWWVTRWIRPGFAYICLAHFGAVTLASLGWIEGPIHALPYPMDYLEIGIIGAFFLLRPLEKRRVVCDPTVQ